MRRNSIASSIVLGALIAGALDMTYAIVYSGLHGVPAIRIMQSVASGLLGKAAYEGGVATAALGLFLHFCIIFAASAAFCWAALRVPLLARRALVSGAVYGVAVYLLMNLVVVPLSAFPQRLSFAPSLVAANLAAHIFLVGIPIALAARRAVI